MSAAQELRLQPLPETRYPPSLGDVGMLGVGPSGRGKPDVMVHSNYPRPASETWPTMYVCPAKIRRSEDLGQTLREVNRG